MTVSSKNIELIQQWQALGKVPSELLKDNALEICKKVGLTSLQSYVYWAEIEKRPGAIDFSTYDEVVEKIRKHGLKWVPFLILGPYYAMPKWFQKTNESVYAKCLEHGWETKIQSIWNPYLPKYVDRFLRLFREHFRDSDVIESIELGISGNWGEALYPDEGGFLQPREHFHTHPGWWCGDRCAISNFRKAMKRKYGSVEKINAAWGERFREFEEVEYPNVKQFGFFRWYIESMRNLVKLGIKTLRGQATTWDRSVLSLMRVKYPPFERLKKPSERRRWLDFMWWYLGSMTEWTEFWIKTAEKYFPTTEIYLATGGVGNPILGADFSAQVKVAAKYHAGIRITNQVADYARNFSLCRLVASASRYYGAYFTTEKAWWDSPRAVVARIFDAATSGAKGVYFNDVIGGELSIPCVPKHHSLGKPTPNTTSFVQNIHHLTGEKPIVEVAILFLNTSIAMNPLVLNSIYSKASQLREVLDFDFVDENMIADNALRKYRFLIMLVSAYVSRRTLTKIKEWIKAGGILIGGEHTNLFATEGSEELYGGFHLRLRETKKIGRGYGVISDQGGRGYLEFVGQAIYNSEGNYPWRGIPEIDSEWDGIYATRFRNKIIYFNSTNTLKIKHVSIKDPSKKFEFELEIQPYSIATIALAPTRKRDK